ncbi:MAG: hypothetical protein WCF06_06965 [Nitrososphaeraceae archaeon]
MYHTTTGISHTHHHFYYPRSSIGRGSIRISQSTQTNSTTNAAAAGVDLKDIHPSPLHLKAGSKFEIFSTVVNNSPSTIMFTAGACQSPLSAQFMRNVVINNITIG